MPVAAFIAGAYTSTFNGSSLGITDDGFELMQDYHAEVIQESDKYGDSCLDLCYRGASTKLTFSCKVYDNNVGAILAPWATWGRIAAAATPVGQLASNVAHAFVLTSTAATPAVASPASLTGSLAVLSENANTRLLFSSKLRKVPIQLRFLPTDNNGTVTTFTTT